MRNVLPALRWAGPITCWRRYGQATYVMQQIRIEVKMVPIGDKRAVALQLRALVCSYVCVCKEEVHADLCYVIVLLAGAYCKGLSVYIAAILCRYALCCSP